MPGGVEHHVNLREQVYGSTIEALFSNILIFYRNLFWIYVVDPMFYLLSMVYTNIKVFSLFYIMTTFLDNTSQQNIQHLFHLIKQEEHRQKNNIELIASENFVSKDILRAQGSILTNKYAEGYPGARYYGGCDIVDDIETIAINKAKELFSCSFANVQPHSGSQANQSVYLSLLKPGDTILSMDLGAGGHLTHGASVSLTGKWFSVISYGLGPDGFVNMEEVEVLAKKHKPKLIIAGASAYPRFIDFQNFRRIADEVGAYLMADIAHIAGLVVTEYHPPVFPWAHVVTTTTHKTLRGPRGGLILSQDEALGKALNRSLFPGLQGGPLMHVIGAKAICFQEALDPSYKDYIRRVVDNAKTLAKGLREKGIPLVTQGTDNHLMILDLRTLGFSGQEAQDRLKNIGITCNKNSVFQDPRPPRETSGLRLGTPAITTRGFSTQDMELLSHWIAQGLQKTPLTHQEEEKIRQEIQSLLKEKLWYS